jgi:hypothetical protein
MASNIYNKQTFNEYKDLPNTAKEAKEKGLTYYFTGKPCKNGHISKRITHNHNCCRCEDIRSVSWQTRTGKGYRYYSPLKARFSRLKSGAKDRGIEFNLIFEDMVWPSHCPIFGVELRYDAKGNDPYGASVDRIDNNKGYVVGNIHIISRRANTIKNDASIDDLKRLVDYFENQQGTPGAAATTVPSR